MRPSCGMRFSARSIPESTFRRERIAFCHFFGGEGSSCSTPSTRKRIVTLRRLGSMWMSEARSCTACLKIRSTNFTTAGWSASVSPVRSMDV